MIARVLKTEKLPTGGANLKSSNTHPAASPRMDLLVEMPGAAISREAAAEDRTESAALNTDAIRWMVAEAAYYKAQSRNFTPGHETEDWLNAEQEVLATLHS